MPLVPWHPLFVRRSLGGRRAEAAALALVSEARTALAAAHGQEARQVGPRTEATFQAALKGNPALEREEFFDELKEFGVDLTK